nr:protein kinase-like domain, phloem protein 2-like protein [Tanacetum cinerariifolium]
FEKVAEMSDISNLNIEIKTDTQLLSPNIVYGVYLVFKLCDSRKVSAKPMYVNLKYRKGSETLQAYFAGAVYVEGIEFRAIDPVSLKVSLGSFFYSSVYMVMKGLDACQ